MPAGIAYAQNHYNSREDLIGRDLRYAVQQGSGWISYLVDDGASGHELHGSSPSIAVGQDGVVQISYASRAGSSDDDLIYADGERWPELFLPLVVRE